MELVVKLALIVVAWSLVALAAGIFFVPWFLDKALGLPPTYIERPKPKKPFIDTRWGMLKARLFAKRGSCLFVDKVVGWEVWVWSYGGYEWMGVSRFGLWVLRTESANRLHSARYAYTYDRPTHRRRGAAAGDLRGRE